MFQSRNGSCYSSIYSPSFFFSVTRPSRKTKITNAAKVQKASVAVALLEPTSNAAKVQKASVAVALLEPTSNSIAVASLAIEKIVDTDNIVTPLKRAGVHAKCPVQSLKKQRLVSFRPLSRAANNVTSAPSVGSTLVANVPSASVSRAIIPTSKPPVAVVRVKIEPSVGVARVSRAITGDVVAGDVVNSGVDMMAKAASGIAKTPTQQAPNIMATPLCINQKSSKEGGLKVFLSTEKNKKSASLFKVQNVVVPEATDVKARNGFGKFEKFVVQLDADVARHISNIETVILRKAFDSEKKLRRIDRTVTYSQFCDDAMHCIDGEQLSLRITGNGFRTKKLEPNGTYTTVLEEVMIETSWMFDMDITFNYWNMNDKHGVAVNAHRFYMIEMPEDGGLNDSLGSFY